MKNALLLLATMASVILPGCSHQAAPEPAAFFGSSLSTTDHTAVGSVQFSKALYATNAHCANAHQRYSNPLLMGNEVVIGTTQPITNLARHSATNNALLLSPGDTISITIHNGEGFNGDYVISPDQSLKLPNISAFSTQHLGTDELADNIAQRLIQAQLFKADLLKVDVQIKQLSAITIDVSGAVFSPGRVLINEFDRQKANDNVLAANGDHSHKRFLSEAIRAASGIRPDADINDVVLLRNGWQQRIDLSGILTGAASQDVILTHGDRIIVPSTGCFQRQLVKPSQISPKGIRVFISNLLDTAGSNNDAAVGAFSNNIPYGSRLLEVAIAGNCLGGSEWTNAQRKVVLSSRNPLTGQQQVVTREVEQLLRSSTSDSDNPFVMPNDSIVCYDAKVTNLRDIGRTLIDILAPLALL